MTLARLTHPAFDGQVRQDAFTYEDYRAVKAELTSYRDILLAKVLKATGLRINETLRLSPEHLRDDGVNLEILVKRGKRRLKAGVQQLWEAMPLPPELGVELRDYVRGQKVAVGERVFPISDRQVRNIFAKAGKAGIGRPVHPHEFRHLYIKTLLDGGLPAEAAAKMVGHADTRTTIKHYYDLNADQRREIQRRVPV